MGILKLMTPSPDPSATSVSSKTPGRDFDDRLSLDYVPDVDHNEIFTETS